MTATLRKQHERLTPLEKADVYDLLKGYGLSAFKAAEVTLDYERGDPVAVGWVSLAQNSVSK